VRSAPATLGSVGFRLRRRQEGVGPVGNSWPDAAIALRILALAVAAVFIQTSVVAELPVFGVRVDLTPLVVAFVGFLSGSTVGAIAGFGIGLMVDLTLLQTLGVTSLIFTFIGYGAGRVREMRDPQATLVPLALGAAAAFVALVGYSVMEFMLGNDAPVSFELGRQILLGTVVDTLLAAPVWVATRRALEPRLPDDPRRRRRRAYTTGGLSPLPRP
jgi:rod shape-determining protein MreD